MKYWPLFLSMTIATILYVYDPSYLLIGLIAIAITALLSNERNNLVGILIIMASFGFTYLGFHPFLGIIVFVIGLILLLYSPLDKTAEKAWEEMKKTDASYPEAKLDAYTKGFSKSAAEYLVQPPNTEINSKNLVSKSSQISKNFFSELKDLFK